MVMLLPWLATMMTVPLSFTFLPMTTSPSMVKWSSSRISGIPRKRLRKLSTFLKAEPSLTTGVPWNSLDES